MNRMYHAVFAWFRPLKPSHQPRFHRPMFDILEGRITPTGNLQTLLGLSQIQAAFPHVDGAGYTVALLDSGINYNLPSLGGGSGAGNRVAYTYNFLNNTTSALDDNGHGTFVANMIGSSDPVDLGIAPKVQIADLKVLDSNLNGPWSAIDSALQWVSANKFTYNIVAVNLSLGSGNFSSDQFSFLENDLANLKNMGVFIAAASGNRFAGFNSQPGLSYPAVDPDVVSVGATWAGNYGAQTFSGASDNSTAPHQVAGFTQRNSALSLLAPGAWIQTIGMNGKETTYGGTSMATAIVSAAAVLLHQLLDQTGQSVQATEQGLLQLMQSTGTTVVDGNSNANVRATGLTFKELNLSAALSAAAPSSAPTLGRIGDLTMTVGQIINVTLPINHAASDPVTISVQETYLPLLAYQLEQQYGLASSGRYYSNYYGFNEKWITDANGTWYWLMPNGEFRRYSGSANATLQPTNLIATLNASYYLNPALLWNAPLASTPPATFAVSGNTLSITSTAYWLGTYTIAVTVADTQHNSVSESFNVTVNPALPLTGVAPTLGPIAAQAMATGQTSLTVALSASNVNNLYLTYQAVAQTPDAAVYVLNQQYAFRPSNVIYYLNLRGANEKWLIGKNNQWYALLPSGKLYRWSQSMAQTLTAANLVAALDPMCYTEPRLLWNANPPTAPALMITFSGNQMTIRRPASLTGVFFVNVMGTNGWGTAQRVIEVTLS